MRARKGSGIKDVWRRAGRPGSLKSWARAQDDEEGVVLNWLVEKARPYHKRKKKGPKTQPRKGACAMRGTFRKPKRKGGKRK